MQTAYGAAPKLNAGEHYDYASPPLPPAQAVRVTAALISKGEIAERRPLTRVGNSTYYRVYTTTKGTTGTTLYLAGWGTLNQLASASEED